MSGKSSAPLTDTPPWLISAIACVFLAAAVITGIYMNTGDKTDIYRFILEPGTDGKNIDQALGSREEFAVYSIRTCTVTVRLFEKSEELSVADIDRRLLPVDPRRSFWVNSIGKFFFTPDGGKEIIYVRTSLNMAAFSAAAGKILGGYRHSYSCPDTTGFNVLILLGAVILFLITVSLIYFHEFRISAVFFLPWTGLIFSLNYSLLFMSMVLTFFILRFIVLISRIFKKDGQISFRHVFSKNRMLSYTLLIIVLLSILYAIISKSFTAVLMLVFAIIYCFAVSLVYFKIIERKGRIKDQEHFRVIPLRGNRYSFVNRFPIARDILFFALVGLFAVATPLINTGTSDIVPEFSAGINDLSHLLALAARQNNPPDMVGPGNYVSHALYQRYYQYGLTDELPQPESEFSIERFTDSALGVVESKEKLFIFTDSLYSDILSHIPDNDAAKLFFDGDSVYSYTYSSAGSSLPEYDRLWLYFAAVLILFLPFLFLNISFGTVGKNSAIVTEIRRSKKYA